MPLKDDIDAYFEREVRPHVPDAWMDRSKDKVGYEINFNRHFYKYTPPRPLEEIDADLKQAEEEIMRLLREVTMTRAVARGLNLHVPLRDSGVPWLGDIPAHWKVVALRFLVSVTSGATPDTGTAAYWDGDIPWVSPEDMKQDVVEDSQDHVSDLAVSGSALRRDRTGGRLGRSSAV